MDVARPGARRTRQDAADRVHRGLLGRFVVDLFRVLIGLPAPAPPIRPARVAPLHRHRFNQDGLAVVLRDRFERTFDIKAIQRGDDFIFERHERLDLTSGRKAQIVERGQVGRTGDRHLQHRPDFLHRRREVFARDLFRQRLHGRVADGEPVQARRRHSELHAQRAEYGIRRGEPEVQQHLPETPFGRRALMFDGEGQLLARDQLTFEQHLAERAAGARHRWAHDRRLDDGAERTRTEFDSHVGDS